MELEYFYVYLSWQFNIRHVSAHVKRVYYCRKPMGDDH